MDDEAVLLCPWLVTVLEFNWKAAITLFGLCQEKRLADEVFAAEDLLGFCEVFRYAGALVARGRFLPDIRRVSESRYEAWWRPAIDREEDRRLARLAARLPVAAACGLPPPVAAEAFLEEMVDRLVRVSVVTTLSLAQAERGKSYSAHDAWFSALRGESRGIRWEAVDELDTLHSHLELWRRPVEGGRACDEQVVLRLHEPPEPALPWTLQASFASADCGRPTENMLLSLGQAAMLFPPLGGAEAQGDGLSCHLSSLEAHAFLSVSSTLLSASGYEVHLPPWWQQEATHALSLEADVSPHQQKTEAPKALLDEKVDIRWSVTLNGEPVTPEELESLLQAQSPLVYFRGQWIQVDVRQIQNALRVGRRKTDDTHSALEVVRLALGTGLGHYGLEVSAVRGCGWLDPFLKRLCGEQAFETLSTPEAFCGELRPYQVRGFSWLVYLRSWGFGACLADDMGLGKTIQALAFLLYQKAAGEKRTVLLVGPMSVLGNWVKEAQRFAPDLRVLLHHGANRSHGDSFVRETQSVDMVITSYHLLYRDYNDLRKVEWAGLLLDEAQNIKNPDTHQAQAARALQAAYRIALTGTPMENHVGDVWSLMDFLNPGMLGKRSVFRDTFYRPIQSGTDPSARTRLKRVTTPFILRRLKTDKQIIADLPEKVEGKVYCPLTPEQAKLYEEVLESFQRDLEQTEGTARRGLILAVLTRLKQVCNHPAHYLRQTTPLPRRSGKLVRLEEMLEEVFERGESALVFTQYAEMGALLKRHLCHVFGYDMPFLHGGVPRQARDRLVQEFQESAQPLAFILSLKAGGTGLNLTRATHVFHFDRWWNPAVENQATDRAFRIGQTRNVMVHKFICGGTLEDRIDAMIERKTALAGEIVTSGEMFLTELSNTELRDILRLSETAVVDE
jgi:superfamily II DNA or RNA helicase